MIIQNRIISKTFVEMISGEKTVLSCVDWQITGEGPQERGGPGPQGEGRGKTLKPGHSHNQKPFEPISERGNIGELLFNKESRSFC